MIADPTGEFNKTDAEAESAAEKHAVKVEGEPNTMSKANAEKRVSEIFGLPPKEETKKK